jgi:hypothetical protein
MGQVLAKFYEKAVNGACGAGLNSATPALDTT